MSLLHPGYRAEILGGLRATSAPVRQYVLRVPEPTLRARIDAAPEPAGTIRWRHQHVAAALAELPGLAGREPDTIEIDCTDRGPREVAAEIARQLGLAGGEAGECSGG